ncbi:phosphoglycan beta 13 galactosyltransferase (SCGR6) [Leptomonas pyrrhocoris]|uniref:Phosphoglycan beta 13 galactosyltransferase (SCGR6) n=1 Tax=Leptomonas pyrrhocoris TaxID=157538 RepID=A0A0M9FRZ0_LEPPY|nr:phosphoglycan beta 13 galactosyltransferase (SCGR6) [Leptomonas pyrrhocoris]XP_015653300.1 phosphoglycan beta 13 galactosyltransferase (SCGR6) [Leptomonas pyrrhocoris]KPA74860.1 phosphoglycan beta 13 galactosyltransferase (SCGR6) [Leptomonas pyrrhocoris]KPA74861.1 phosphoglycan beta 13 galactosyltransferase (SCGR6) [Leptomonas pyrrhocoris]|eukprot:XP_015653299.1 phosphoglycan beta 13 galactosyltransferase (SCGR6) [Leptomonas pyrrhocoris]
MLTVGPRRMVVGLLTRVASSRRRSSPVKDDVPRGPMRLPISILVQHDGVAQRLKHAFDHPHWPPPNCSTDSAFCSAARDGAPAAAGAATDGDVGGRGPRLSRDMVPSWTLQTVDADCADCVDHYAYDLAVRDVQLRGRRGVFALSRSPRGMLGPMLLAMSSVTDDVDVATELPQWGWLRHVYPNFPAALRSQPPRRRPYLAVMGVPSTDQPARLALRDAQRATWMSYHEVARNENAFEGALLPLYLFAAAEPETEATAARQDMVTTSALCSLCNNVSTLLPLQAEFVLASKLLLAQDQEGGDLAYRGPGVAARRVRLRERWMREAVTASPCSGVVVVREEGGTTEEQPGNTYNSSFSGLSYLSAALSLPVTPAFVAPAQLVCCASAALWRETLEYRNVIWLDMMTDRRPTTNKTLGSSARWGFPVEIGMSQKLVLWLTYAYHAFPSVPYIIKGDDDAYIKVPQYLSDLRFFSSGGRVRLYAQPTGTNASSSLFSPAVVDPVVEVVEDAAMTPNQTECVYWGSVRNFYAYEFAAGMNFKVHRTVARALLEQYYATTEVNWLQLAMEDYHPNWTGPYEGKLFHHEDIMLGVAIGRTFGRVRALCPNHKVWFVKESFSKFHDMHRGKVHDVTWATVVAHRCTPADFHFLHYFFQHEYSAASCAAANLPECDAVARAGAAEWIDAQKAQMVAAEAGSANTTSCVEGWETLPLTAWTRHVNLTRLPPFVVSPYDGVAVYASEYELWEHNATRVFHGLVAHVFPYTDIPV